MSFNLECVTHRECHWTANPALWAVVATAIAATTAALYITAFLDPLVTLFYLALVVAPLSLVLFLAMFVRPWRNKKLMLGSILAAYLICTATGFRTFRPYRLEIRWLFTSQHYKRAVLSQPSSTNGQFRHTEFGAWGLAPAGNTFVYLVYDPSDSLLTAGKSYRDASLNGLPCDVSEIKRLQQSWYAVVFYTDTDWKHCPPKF